MPKLVFQQYHFLVEGECEERYLRRLQELINERQDIGQKVSFVIKRGMTMTSMVKNLSPWVKTTIVEVMDYEGSSQSDQQTFVHALDDMEKASHLKPGVKCVLGYSNLTFELWILLHKMDCRRTLDNKKQYLDLLNQAYKSKFAKADIDELFDGILSLKSREECYRFFEDICTTNEVLSIAERFEVAKLLYQNNTYIEIAAKTGASTATISRVNRFLANGNGSCDFIFERLGISKDKE